MTSGRKQLKKRITASTSEEQHFLHWMALTEEEPVIAEDVLADEEGVAPFIAIVSQNPPAMTHSDTPGTGKRTTSPEERCLTDET